MAEADPEDVAPLPHAGREVGVPAESPPPAPYLIGAIRAVVVPVTLPPACDAAAIGTRELALRAGPRCWGQKRGGSAPEHRLRGWQGTLADCLWGAQDDRETLWCHGTGERVGAQSVGRAKTPIQLQPRAPCRDWGPQGDHHSHADPVVAAPCRAWSSHHSPQGAAAGGDTAEPWPGLAEPPCLRGHFAGRWGQSPPLGWQLAPSSSAGPRHSMVSFQGWLLGPVPSPVVQDASRQTSQLAGRAEANRSGFRGRGCTGRVEGGRWAEVLGPRTSHAWVPVVPGSRTGPILPAEPVEGCAVMLCKSTWIGPVPTPLPSPGTYSLHFI